MADDIDPYEVAKIPRNPDVIDPYEMLKLTRNPDGSLTRGVIFPTIPPSGDHQPTSSKDLPLNPTLNTSLRLFLPSPPPTKKVPIVIYFHGGGFIIFSPAISIMHDSCVLRSSKLPALIVSVDYRLAPEHRLPAAYDDAVDALLWVRDQARSPSPDPWMRDYADYTRCFVAGTSSGGNIAYHLGLRSLDLDLAPVKVAGLILSQAFFGGEERTASEARAGKDKATPLAMGDMMWELALPEGANRDHEYSNPMAEIGRARGLKARVLVKGFLRDPLIDRMRAVAEGLEREGVRVVKLLESDGFHGNEIFSEGKAEELVDEFRRFIYYDDGGTESGGKQQ